MSTVDARLRRLISSEICKGDSVEKYVIELKKLAGSIGDEHHFRSKERFFKALSDSTRLKIIKMLEMKEMCV